MTRKDLQSDTGGFKDADVVRGTVGMSKRFYAACAAMQGLLGNQNLTERLEETGEFFHGLVNDSYIIADELLKQEDK